MLNFQLDTTAADFFCSDKYRKQTERGLKESCHEFLIANAASVFSTAVGCCCPKRHFA